MKYIPLNDRTINALIEMVREAIEIGEKGTRGDFTEHGLVAHLLLTHKEETNG